MKSKDNKSTKNKKNGSREATRKSGPGVKPNVAAAKNSPPACRINISRQSREVAEIMARIEKLPDVRDDKVQAIKEAIETGRYEVDPLKVAGKILSEL